ncbi:MAG TPA: EpsI family protein, partial [Bryobacteraceae bacterium]|nr:EpsI family protein [Bryobacteraceae bacterium]
EWYHDEDMSHGFVVPLAAGWLAWQQRKRLAEMRPSGWGLVLVLAGAALQFLGAISLGLFVGALGLVCAVVGVLLAAGGLPWLWALAFPLFLLVFMLPKPDFVWNRVTLPLQLLASQLAAVMVRQAGTVVLREGNVLTVAGHQIAVEEACNGIRYLWSLGLLALLWGHVAGLRGWRRALLGAAAVPVAILVNAMRVAGVAVMCRYNYGLAVGAFHDASGWAALALAVVLLMGIERAVRRLPASAPTEEPRPVPSPVVRPVWLVAAALILAAQLVPTTAAPLLESPPRLPRLSRFPETLGVWRMIGTVNPQPDAMAGADADDYLQRFYAGPLGGSGEMELRVAYHRSQRVHGRMPHSPLVCLPANGWTPVESRILQVPGGEVNLYVAEKAGARATVLYWYQTPWQTTAGEWKTHAWVVVNGILHRRTDVALVRLVLPGTGDRGAELRAALGFAQLVMAEVKTQLH